MFSVENILDKLIERNKKVSEELRNYERKLIGQILILQKS